MQHPYPNRLVFKRKAQTMCKACHKQRCDRGLFGASVVCYNIENVKEQHQGEAESQSIQGERKHPQIILASVVVCGFVGCCTCCFSIARMQIFLLGLHVPDKPSSMPAPG